MEHRVKEPEVRIENPGEKQSKLTSSQVLAPDYWILQFRLEPYALRLAPLFNPQSAISNRKSPNSSIPKVTIYNHTSKKPSTFP
jgi:hypothetical protein